MSISACDAGPLPVPKEQLAKDLEYATRTVEALAKAIASEMPWQGGGNDDDGCFATDGRVTGYQATYFLRLKSEAVGHDLDDVEAFGIARTWLNEQGYKFTRDTQHENGLREIWAVNEKGSDGIGVSVRGHPGVISLKATTKCRS